MTLSLFAPKVRLTPRWYQQEASEAVDAALEKHRATCLLMATGLGKAVIIGMKVGQWVRAGGRVLVLAHRDELVRQLKAEVERVSGYEAYIEQADIKAPFYARVVVASIQTLARKSRLHRFGKDAFTHVIPDELHHYVSPTYRRPLDYFEEAKIFGVTATPDRLDKKALGRIIDDVAYTMDIEDGIEHGYLVPVDGKLVEVDEIHLEDVKIVAGDLEQQKLDAIMLQAVEGVVKKTLELEPHRQGIGFFPGVASAQAACDRMNALKPGSACMIHGGTDPQERQDSVRKFKAHIYQYLFNCQVATEGFDAPCCNLVIQARPTKSRSLVTQMVGRGTRPLTGVIDPFPGRDQAAERRAAIAASDKPGLMVLDFVGNSTRHSISLASVEDLLGGKYDDDEIELAKKIRKEREGADRPNPTEALKEARSRLHEALSSVKSTVTARVIPFSPFQVFGLEHNNRYDQIYGRSEPTAGQRSVLQKAGVSDEEIASMSKRQASKVIDEVVRRRRSGLCTLKQLKRLQRAGVSERDIGFREAGKALDYLKGRKDSMVDRGHLHRLLGLDKS